MRPRDRRRIRLAQREMKPAHLKAIRTRIRRSIDDPRPNMTEKGADAHFKALFARAAKVKTTGPKVRFR
jgi:antitoxin ParD1/3/4